MTTQQMSRWCSSQSSDLRFDDPDESDGPAPLPAAGVDGSAGQGNLAATPVGGPDVSSLTGTSTPPLFPSMPKTIDQSTLVDLISMWTLLQRRLDQPSVQDDNNSPPVKSSLPAPGHDSTNRRSVTPAGSPERRPKSPERFLHTPQSSISSLVRRAKEAERQARTPVRPPRMPVRRARNHSESRDSRSRSPLSRSSSVESTARDESPLNFNAALDVDSNRDISEDEDSEGDSKKISAAHYEIFRQAVTTSKGTYKVNPAKTKRAARVSLLDLGDTEVPDRVSWLDQPSLQDTMASMARIAQGLKEDEEVVKTTLLETLNDNTSSFKFFTVKQIFPREPYRLKIHRDALYAFMDSLTTRPHLHTICHIGYVWTLRSWPGGPPSTHLLLTRWWLQWLKNFLSRMNARNFSERSWPSQGWKFSVSRRNSVTAIPSGTIPVIRAEPLRKVLGYNRRGGVWQLVCSHQG